MKEAVEEVQRLQCLPVTRDQKLRHCRAFGLAKCTYGWMARTPPQGAMAKVTTAIWKCVGGCRAASRNVKHLLEGGTLATDVVIGSRQVGALMKRLHRDGNPERYKERAWKRGTLVNIVHNWMEAQGWEEDEEEEWKWAHEGLGITIDLKESQWGAKEERGDAQSKRGMTVAELGEIPGHKQKSCEHPAARGIR